ncbi:MAG TPA: PAS domain S-box protein [Candidatus Brocadiia bacterium]|nr:PAS domain S-box protein [Candidatus Brocadiia bacterium]
MASKKKDNVEALARQLEEAGKRETAMAEQMKRVWAVQQDLIESSRIPIIIADLQGRPIDVNRACCDLTGFSREELLGTEFGHLNFPEDTEQNMAMFRSIVENGHAENVPWRLRAKNGEELRVVATAFLTDDRVVGLFRGAEGEDALQKRFTEAYLRYVRLAETAFGGIYVTRGDRFLYVNPALCEIAGTDRESLLKSNPYDFIHPEDRPRLIEIGAKRLKGEPAPTFFEARSITPGGKVKHCQFSVSAITFEGEYAAQGTVRDITAQVEAGEALADSERKFRNLAEGMSEGVALTVEGKNYWVNKTFAGIFGYEPEKMLGKGPDLVIAPEELPRIRSFMKARLAEEGAPARYETVAIKKDGTRINIEVGSRLTTIEGKQCIQIVVRDITRRKKNEAALRQSEQMLRSVVDNIGVGISIIDKDMRILSLNRQMRQWFPDIDVSQKPICYKTFNNPPRDEICSYCPTCKTIRDGLVHEDVTETPQGCEIRRYRIISSPLRDHDGNVSGAIEMVDDITERARAEDAIKQSEERLRAIFENATDGILIAEIESGRFLACNKALCAMLGYSEEEVKRLTVADIHPKNSLPIVMVNFRKQVTGEAPVSKDTPVLCKDGSIFYVDVNASPITLDGRKCLMGLFRDVTERRRSEEEIRRLSQFLNLVVQNANVWLDVVDTEGRVVLWNKAAEAISGYLKDECVGHNNVWEWLYPDESYREEITRSAAKAIEGADTVEDFETTIRAKSGQEKIISWYSRNLIDENGNSMGTVSLGRDITPRKRAEAEIREYNRRLEILNRVISAGNQARDLRELLAEILDSAIALTRFDSGGIYMIDSSRTARLVVATNTLPAEFKEEFGNIPVDLQPYNRVLCDGEPLFVEAPQGILTERLSDPWGLKSIASIPLFSKSEVIGALNLASGRAAPFSQADKDILITIGHEVSSAIARFQAEQALRESEELYRTLVESTDEAVFTLDRTGHILYANRMAGAKLGRPPAELIGNPVEKIFDTDEAADLRQFVGEVMDSGEGRELETGIDIRGELRWFRTSVQPVKDSDGRPVSVLFTAADVTGRKNAEKQLAESEIRFRSLVQNSSDMVMIMRPDGEVIYESPAVENVLGYKAEELVGTNSLAYIKEEDVGRVRQQLEKLLKGDAGVERVEFRARHKNGSWVWVEAVGMNLLDNPSVNGIVVNSRDISERRQAEDALRESEERFRTIFESARDAIYIKDIEGRYVQVNPATEHLFGVPAERMIGSTCKEIFDPETARKINAMDSIVLRGEIAEEEQVFNVAGEDRTVQMIKVPMCDSGGRITGLCGIARDITDLKDITDKIRRYAMELERRNIELEDARSSSMRMLTEVEALRARVEQEAVKLRTIIEGVDSMIVLVGPDDCVSEVNSYFLTVMDAERDKIIGRPVLPFHPGESQDRLADLLKEFHQGRHDPLKAVVEFGNRSVSLRVHPLFSGRVYAGAILTGTDVTDLVQARKAAEEASRMKSEFIATVSHEFRTPIHVIMGFAEMLVSASLPGEHAQWADTIRENGKQLFNISQNVLTIADIEAGRVKAAPAPTNVAVCVAELAEIHRPLAEKKGVELTVTIDKAIPEIIETDEGHLRSIVAHLIQNAVKFTDKGGVSIKASREKNAVRISVSDTGVGIPRDRRERIMDAFVQADSSRTRAFGGMGLGLAVANRLAGLLGSFIELSSRPGKGSTFSLRIPFTPPRPDEAPAAPHGPPPRGGPHPGGTHPGGHPF